MSVLYYIFATEFHISPRELNKTPYKLVQKLLVIHEGVVEKQKKETEKASRR